MKKLIFTFIVLVALCNLSNAQTDTMYIMKSGLVIGKYSVTNQVDSIIFYNPVQEQKGGTFTDSRDGNTYKWIDIGNQVWMAENLKYLPSVIGPATNSQTTPYFYVYGYDGTNVSDAKETDNYKTYGVLYNWLAAMNGNVSSSTNPSGVQGICPAGWHLPSDEEWNVLNIFLQGSAGKLKEAGTSHWTSPNLEATNETGFTALPGGGLFLNGTFDSKGTFGYWWSTTEYDSYNSMSLYLSYGLSSAIRNGHIKNNALSVRCLKD